MKKIVVIGGMNIDILASANPLHFHDSSVGSIQTSYGGVGRNIAENIARLGLPVHLCSVIGDDAFGRLMLEHAHHIGINTSLVEVKSNVRTGSYLAVSDHEDMVVGVNDMDITSQMDRAWADTYLPQLLSFDVIVIEPNIPKETLTYLMASLKDKIIIVDPVSAIKASRLVDVLPYISVIKCNRLELSALSNTTTIDEGLLHLLTAGVSRVIVTQGKDDVIDYSAQETKHHTPVATAVVNVTGAGDAFTAGIVAGIAMAYSNQDQITLAMKMSQLALQSSTTVSTQISSRLVKEKL